MLDIQGYKELYEQERLKVYNMDCMELLKQVPDKYFDLAIVDPPYGINMSKNAGKSIKYESKTWDNKRPNNYYFNEVFRISKDQIIWGGNYFLEYLPSTPCFIVWDKRENIIPTRTFADGEIAWTSFKMPLRFFRHYWDGFLKKVAEDRIHPTQKPVALYTWLLEKYAKPNFKIIDTHFGSGSHAIANHYYGSELIACELDEDYFKASIERIKKETRQLSFLQGGG